MKQLTEAQIAQLNSKFGESSVRIYKAIASFVELGTLVAEAEVTDEEIDNVASLM